MEELQTRAIIYYDFRRRLSQRHQSTHCDFGKEANWNNILHGVRKGYRVFVSTRPCNGAV